MDREEKRGEYNLRVGIGGLKVPFLGNPSLAVDKEVVALENEPVQVTVEVGHDGKVGVGEAGALDENLRTHAGVDPRGLRAFVAAVVDVDGAEPDAGLPTVDVGPVVVVVGNVEEPGVLTLVAVRVPDETPLPVVAELVPADRDHVRRVGDIQEAVEVVLVAREALGREGAVVDPDLGGLVEADDVLALGGVVEV